MLQVWSLFAGWEGTAMVLALAYLFLAVKENILCWYAAFISSFIYAVVFWDVNLLMESALSVYYVVMAVYGWWQWRGGISGQSPSVYSEEPRRESPIIVWSKIKHVKALMAIVVVSLISGYLLSENTNAVWPYLDSFTTWASVFTTWLLTKKVLENWLYWIVIDFVSIFLYADRELYATVLLFSVYTVMAVFGYRQWRKNFQQSTVNDASLQAG